MADESLFFLHHSVPEYLLQMFHKFFDLVALFFFSLVLFTVGCSAQTEDQALVSLRQMTKDGKLPPENLVISIETRFDGTKTGTLARLLHARIRF